MNFLRSYFFPSRNIDINTNIQTILDQLSFVFRHDNGVYGYLPLGKRVIDKLNKLITSELDKLPYSSQCSMPILQNSELWKLTGREEAYGCERMSILSRSGSKYYLSPTAEDIITSVCKERIQSYKQLPLFLWQTSTKFRDEIRCRGLSRCKEFIMHDGYSIGANISQTLDVYIDILNTYNRIFSLIFSDTLFIAKGDSGEIGGDMTHEIIVPYEDGETIVYCNNNTPNFKTFKNIQDVTISQYHLEETKGYEIQKKGIEIGHVFYFGNIYSEKINATCQNPDGSKDYLSMGSHGIGVSRLFEVIARIHKDDKGIKFPKAVAPFLISLIPFNDTVKYDELLEYITDDIVIDDSESSLSYRCKNSNLIGIPYNILIFEDKYVVRSRENGDIITTSNLKDIVEFITDFLK